jgi:hypothetical protein
MKDKQNIIVVNRPVNPEQLIDCCCGTCKWWLPGKDPWGYCWGGERQRIFARKSTYSDSCWDWDWNQNRAKVLFIMVRAEVTARPIAVTTKRLTSGPKPWWWRALMYFRKYKWFRLERL